MISKEEYTAVIGASPNPARYSFLATESLVEKGFLVHPVGLRKGEIVNQMIHTDLPELKNVHTVTLYVGPRHQDYWKDYILSLNPKRIIFNPGTENSELERIVSNTEIEVLRACTLVMLSIGSY